jgi:phosphoglycolate phosphatase-like HAD superfamily hydrolase
MANKTLAIDFDGVIHSYLKGWQDGEIYGAPMEGAREYMERLKSRGYTLIVFTTRVDHGAVVEWLKKYKIPFDGVTNIKPIATAYIDDRAIRFTNWRDINNYFA